MSPHREIFSKLVLRKGWTYGVELGVDRGILFAMLLNTCPRLRLIGVDLFPDRERAHQAFAYADHYADRARLIIADSVDAAAQIPDGTLDFVFIDADHSYESVLRDIAAWRSKVRVKGWFGGHDYNKKFPGVVRAVDLVFGRKVIPLPGSIWSAAA